MKYIYGEGIERQKGAKWPFAVFGVILLGAYLYINIKAPVILAALEPVDTTANKLATAVPNIKANRLYAPKINLDTPIAGAGSDEVNALDAGAAQRSASSGNPKDGGNFVLAAHRFSFSLNPIQTNDRSAFYHLGKLAAGDDVYVDYDGTRYAYKVQTHAFVETVASGTESRTDEPSLTLYSIESQNGKREVVTAKMVGHVVWVDGKPKLQTTDDITSSL
jgi:sortase A